MSGPVDYKLFDQTVTVYRKEDTGITRTEIPGCYLQWQEEVAYAKAGQQKQRKFLLVQPGAEQQVFPGDRVYEGVGPEVTEEAWGRFIPALVPALGEVEYAVAYSWQGQFCHTEAGRK